MMAFEHALTVRFREVDGAGIVFFSRVFEYAHDAFEALLQHMDLPLNKIVSEAPWIMPLVHAEADYRAPMRLGETLLVQVTVENLGKRSIGLAYRVVAQDSGTLKAVVKHRHAFVDKSVSHSIPVPETFKAALKASGLEFLDQQATDHA